MKKYLFAAGLAVTFVAGSSLAFAQGLALTPTSGKVNSLVTVSWPSMPLHPTMLVASVESDDDAMRQFSLPLNTASDSIAFCFPAQLDVLSESGVASTVAVVPGTYHISIQTDADESDIMDFTVVPGVAGTCASTATFLAPGWSMSQPDPVEPATELPAPSTSDVSILISILRSLPVSPDFPQSFLDEQIAKLQAYLVNLKVSVFSPSAR